MEGGAALTRVTRTAPTPGPATAGRVAGGTHTHALTRMSWVESPEQRETGSARTSSVGVSVVGEVLWEVSGQLPVEPWVPGRAVCCILRLTERPWRGSRSPVSLKSHPGRSRG